MLKRIRLTSFKSFADAEIELAPLTLLAGANASGKRNLLDALRFLQGTALGMTFDEILNGHLRGGVAVWPGIPRGGERGWPCRPAVQTSHLRQLIGCCA